MAIPFDPDYCVHPGAILAQFLEDRSMSPSAFAQQAGLSEDTVQEILQGDVPLSSEMSQVLERITDIKATLWNNLEAAYREDLRKGYTRVVR